MAIAQRRAEVVWEGNLARGAGALSSGSGALELPVTWASRTEQPDGKTSPEELIAAAHGSCFAMALALVLGENHIAVGANGRDRDLHARRGKRRAADHHRRAHRLRAGARARPAQDSGATSNRRLELCPVSNALRGNVEISVRDELDEGWSRETAVPQPSTAPVRRPQRC